MTLRLLGARARRGAGRRLPPVRLPARARNTLAGWVLNADDGVEIHLEGEADAGRTPSCAGLESRRRPPPAIAAIRRRGRATPTGLRRVHHPGESSGATARRPGSPPTWPCATRCLGELFDPADPRAPLSLHQLHRLRPALLDRARPAVRPATHHDARLGRWTRMRRGVPRPGEPPLPCAARRLPGLRPAPTRCGVGEDTMRGDAQVVRCAAAHASRRAHPRDQGPRRLSPGLRRPERGAPSPRFGSGSSARRSRSP